MNDYLWDKSGDPDPDVERLERLLSRFAQPVPPPALALTARPRVVLSTSGRWFGAALLAASVTLAVAGVTLSFRLKPVQAPGIGWQVVKGDSRAPLRVGSWLETNDRERASFNVADIGQVVVEPGTRLRLLSTRAGAHRLEMTRGTINARIWAPPNQFFVLTPSTLAVDLGCAYKLTVDDEGAGLVSVQVGWVGFKWGDRESFIPAGSACPTRPRIGPGTPYNERVSPAYREALATIDFSAGSPAVPTALALVLNESTERDEVTLWHLLSRVRLEDRDRVFERLAAFVPAPAGVTHEGIRAGDKTMLDAWWDALGLGSTSLWRTWSQQWTDTTK